MLLAAPGPHYTHWRSTCRCRQKHAAVAASRGSNMCHSKRATRQTSRPAAPHFRDPQTQSRQSRLRAKVVGLEVEDILPGIVKDHQC